MRYERALGVASRLERLLDLVRTGNYSTPAIATKLAVCEQTVYRDILHLKQRGYSIRARKLAGGWAYQLLGEPGKGPGDEGKGSSG